MRTGNFVRASLVAALFAASSLAQAGTQTFYVSGTAPQGPFSGNVSFTFGSNSLTVLLNNTTNFDLLFGITQEITRIGFSVDDPTTAADELLPVPYAKGNATPSNYTLINFSNDTGVTFPSGTNTPWTAGADSNFSNKTGREFQLSTLVGIPGQNKSPVSPYGNPAVWDGQPCPQYGGGNKLCTDALPADSPAFNGSVTFQFTGLTGVTADWEVIPSSVVISTGTAPGTNGGDCPTCDFPVPIPAAAWLFGSGLLGLIGIARRRQVSTGKAANALAI